MPTNDELWTKLLEVQDRLDQIERSRATEVEQIPELEDDPAIPRVGRIQLLGFNGSDQLDEVIIGFEEPRDAFNFSDIEAYELYSQGNTNIASELIKIGEVTRSPFVLPVVSNLDGVVTFAIRTRMKGGLGTPVQTSPTIAVDIGALRAAIAAGSVGTTELADNAVTTQKIDNLAVTNAKIGNLAVSNAKIGNLAVDNAKIANLAVNNAKISDLVATKLTAGTLIAGVILTSSINATQINAGTMNSVNVNAGTYTLTSSPNTMSIDGTNGFRQLNTTTNQEVRIISGDIRGFLSSSQRWALQANATEGSSLDLENVSGTVVFAASGDGAGGQSNSGSARVMNSGGSIRVRMGVDGAGNGKLEINPAGGTGGQIHFNGIKVLSDQQPTVASISAGPADLAYGAAERDMLNQLKTAVNSLLTKLRSSTGHGIIAG